MDNGTRPDALHHKEQAIASVLPLLHDHHDLIMRVRTSLRTESDYPAPPCVPRDGADELFWVTLAERNRKRYRLDAVTQALERLHASGQPRASAMVNALYSTFIEPWDRYLTEAQRRRYAGAGLRYLATAIPGEMPDYREPRPSRRDLRDREIKRMLDLGFSTRHISRLLHCSTVTIQAVREGRRVHHGALDPIAPST